jgi:hypothetical protein
MKVPQLRDWSEEHFKFKMFYSWALCIEKEPAYGTFW